MHGLGNDFIIIDAINQTVNLSTDTIRYMADRHFGIGFDQLLLVEKSNQENIDFKYRIFNADGGEVEQCGNGARCFALFVQKKQLSNKNPLAVETAKGIIHLFVEEDKVRVDMGIPNFNPESLPFTPPCEPEVQKSPQNKNDYQLALTEPNSTIIFSAVSVGNPHITLNVKDIENYPVTEVGKILESHSCFPQRVNVGFMQIDSPEQIQLRVYERGCGETLACGSGACAAVVNGISQGLLANQVQVKLRGGNLKISWDGPKHTMWMEGSASFVYEGQIDL